MLHAAPEPRLDVPFPDTARLFLQSEALNSSSTFS